MTAAEAEALPARPKAHGPMAENLEAIVMAVVLAVLLKYFIIEAYKIPTGSMQPTLVGDESSQVQDRILVDKLSYYLRAPKRWEVCVFRYPLDRSKSFVKRIVGVGPEELRIRFGDIWHRQPEEPWEVLRRPRSVQRSAWKRIDSDPTGLWQPLWEAIATKPGLDWEIDGGNIDARGSGTAQFRSGSPSIIDDYLHGYPEPLALLIQRAGKRSGNNMVGDLRLEGEITAMSGTRSVAIVFKEGKRNYRFMLPGPESSDTAAPWIDADGLDSRSDDPAGPEPWRLPAGQAVRFAVQNMDDLLEIEIEGEIVAAIDIDPAAVQSSSIYIEIEGEGGAIRDLRAYRDIFYTSNGTRTIEIPEGHYYMLGDNTQESCDSREWRYSILSFKDSESLRGNLRRGENPRIVGVGDPDGPKTFFVDEWGEPHWFRNSDILARRTSLSPFVPRAMIQGKAVAVFWPLDPRRDIFRLRWVN